MSDAKKINMLFGTKLAEPAIDPNQDVGIDPKTGKIYSLALPGKKAKSKPAEESK